MIKKICLVLIILLLFVNVNQSQQNHVYTLFVDDDNTIGPWDGSEIHPYDTIQKAVDNASEGDLIFVKSGRYNGNIIIEKTLNLIGENRYLVEIIGGKHDLWVHADDVLITNFTIVNSSRYFSGIYISSSGCRIEHNIIKNNYAGVYLDGGTSNIVNDNVFLYNDDRSVRVEFSHENYIMNNYVGFGGDGIYCWSSSKNKIKANTVDNCLRGIILGDNCLDNLVYQNNLFRNHYFNGDDFSTDNNWYDEDNKKGNFWDDYKGMDNDNDGIGDSQYELPTFGVDKYPLIQPYNFTKPILSFTGGWGLTVQIEQNNSKKLTTLMQFIADKNDFSLKDEMYEIIGLNKGESIIFKEHFFGFGKIDIEIIIGPWHWFKKALLFGPFILLY